MLKIHQHYKLYENARNVSTARRRVRDKGAEKIAGGVLQSLGAFFLLFVFVNLLKLVKKKILKKGIEFFEELNNFFDFVILIVVKHGAFAGFKPVFIDAKTGGNQADNPFVNFFVSKFNAGYIPF
jgi:hypothetical protein